MKEALKTKLLKVSPERLIDLLFEFANEDDISLSKIERLVTSHKENISRFLKRLKKIKSRSEFVSRGYASQFGSELIDVLRDLEISNLSAEEGYDFICNFYETDGDILEQCDDSDGFIGEIFRRDAFDLYVKFAKPHLNREYLVKKTFDLVSKNEYGARDELVSSANKFLSPNELRQLFDLIAITISSECRHYSIKWKLSSIAKQLGDAPLFEKLHLQGIADPNGRILVEVAEVYFDSGNLQKSQEILDSLPRGDLFCKYEKEKLQKKIFSTQGKTEALFELLHSAFLENPSEHTLEELKTVTNTQDLQQFVEEAKATILTKTFWNTSHAKFLNHIDCPEVLSQYVLKHHDRMDGRNYDGLPELADYLAKRGQYLTASLVLRVLIEGTLNRANSKYYHHAVRYLEKLNLLEKLISDWYDLLTNEQYLIDLKKHHGLKKSFWSKCQA